MTATVSGEKRSPLWSGLALLGLAFAAVIATVVYKAFATFNFERTDGAIFTGWTYAEFDRAAGVGFVVTMLATLAFFLLRRRHPELAVGVAASAVLVVAALIGGAALSHERRSHPINKERAIARSVPLPASWGPGTLQVLNPTADFPGDSPPSVTRVVDLPLAYPSVCRQLFASLTGWNGARFVPWGGGSKLGPLTPNLSSGLGCSMHGTTPQGWSITLTALVHQTRFRVQPDELGNVPAGTTRVLVRIATPG